METVVIVIFSLCQKGRSFLTHFSVSKRPSHASHNQTVLPEELPGFIPVHEFRNTSARFAARRLVSVSLAESAESRDQVVRTAEGTGALRFAFPVINSLVFSGIRQTSHVRSLFIIEATDRSVQFVFCHYPSAVSHFSSGPFHYSSLCHPDSSSIKLPYAHIPLTH